MNLYILSGKEHTLCSNYIQPGKWQFPVLIAQPLKLNTLRPRQNGRHFPDDIFKWIFLNENVWISINMSLKFVPKGPINNIKALVQIMAWRRPGDKPLSEPMLIILLTHICVTRPQWVNGKIWWQSYICARICELCSFLCEKKHVIWIALVNFKYCKISNISGTKSQNLNVSCSCCSHLCTIYWSKVLNWEWRCSWSSADNFIAYQGAFSY